MDEFAPVLEIDLSAPPAIPASARTRVDELLETGWLHRYGETLGENSDASRLEATFAEYVDARFCVATNSCGSAMFLALTCADVKPGDTVLMNAFTLAPVPGAVAHAGARHALVEITDDLTIDLDDLEKKAQATGARVLLLSHMRGHISDMSKVMEIAERHAITVIEDCAHTMGATFDGTPSGRFGAVGCYSLQAYKHINAGEGGLLVTDDEDIAARAILYTGSYMLYGQHRLRPDEGVFARWKDSTPNYSLRMSNLVAALALPQVALLDERAAQWNGAHDRLAAGLGTIDGLALPARDPREAYVQSSIQFRVSDLTPTQFSSFLAACKRRGVFLKWFGAKEATGYTSMSEHWQFMADPHTPAHTRQTLERLCDMRIPLGLPLEACDAIVTAIRSELDNARAVAAA